MKSSRTEEVAAVQALQSVHTLPSTYSKYPVQKKSPQCKALLNMPTAKTKLLEMSASVLPF